jgi:hypothetical protein
VREAARAERTPAGARPQQPPPPPELTPPGGRRPHAPGAVRSTTLAQAPAPRRPTSNPPAPAEPSIQLDPQLQAEVEAALPYESTLITRNPLLEQQRPRGDEDDTSPGARYPGRR